MWASKWTWAHATEHLVYSSSLSVISHPMCKPDQTSHHCWKRPRRAWCKRAWFLQPSAWRRLVFLNWPWTLFWSLQFFTDGRVWLSRLASALLYSHYLWGNCLIPPWFLNYLGFIQPSAWRRRVFLNCPWTLLIFTIFHSWSGLSRLASALLYSPIV